MRRLFRTASLVPVLALGSSSLWSGALADDCEYVIDRNRSSITFEIRHVLMNVEGRFTDFGGCLHQVASDVTRSRVAVTIDAGSIDTDLPDRDRELRGPDFLDVERYPQITFRSREVSAADGLKILGDLTMHGVTRSITLEAREPGVPGLGAELAFEATATLKRRDFGITWNKLLDGGVSVIGDEVKIAIHVVAVEAKVEPASRSSRSDTGA